MWTYLQMWNVNTVHNVQRNSMLSTQLWSQSFRTWLTILKTDFLSNGDNIHDTRNNLFTIFPEPLKTRYSFLSKYKLINYTLKIMMY